jgi:DNA-binding beta-propeller fold protein YncE
VLAVLAIGAAACADTASRFEVLTTIEIATAPSGIRFSDDGDTAFVALPRAGAIAVVDLDRAEVVDRWETGGTPIDLLPTGRGWLVSNFGDSTLALLDPDGRPAGEPIVVGPGPSLFTLEAAWGLSYIASQFANRLTAIDTEMGIPVVSFPTGDRPYPPSAMADGSLAFIPHFGDGTVMVLDLLAEEVAATVEVCPGPQGGALTRDGVHYLVACGFTNEIAYLNTASFEVTARVSEGVGPRPFSIAVTRDGRYGVVNNADSTTVSILDISARRVIQDIDVGGKPMVVRVHPDGRRVLVSVEGAGILTVLEAPPPPRHRQRDERNEVVVLGTIHGDHRVSDRYGIEVLEKLVRAIDPDYWLVEIPPNRLDRAAAEFGDTGGIDEPRVALFPEYVDVLFPLTRELRFEVVATAGWNRHMSDFRAQRLREIQDDPAWAAAWQQFERASARADSAVGAGGEPDDPRWIHTDAYDEAIEIRYAVYNRLFNDELGPGGWDHINAAHYANISETLDRHRGEGRRFLITYGAGHKGWFLRNLRERDDIELLDVAPFLDRIGR